MKPITIPHISIPIIGIPVISILTIGFPVLAEISRIHFLTKGIYY